MNASHAWKIVRSCCKSVLIFYSSVESKFSIPGASVSLLTCGCVLAVGFTDARFILGDLKHSVRECVEWTVQFEHFKPWL